MSDIKHSFGALANGDRNRAIELLVCQHTLVHSADVSGEKVHSFADELSNHRTDEEIRQIPAAGEHSVAWIIFHPARIEDITMNMLAAGAEQLFTRHAWAPKMNISIMYSANERRGAKRRLRDCSGCPPPVIAFCI